MAPRPRVVLLALLALVVMAGAARTLVHADTPKELRDVDGKAISLRGAVTELAFGAAWCRPCERELAGVRQRSGRWRGRGYKVVLVGVSARQTEAQFVEWARGAGMRGTLAFDAEGRIEKAFEARSLPWFVVLDARGAVLHSAELPPDGDKLQGWLSGSRR